MLGKQAKIISNQKYIEHKIGGGNIVKFSYNNEIVYDFILVSGAIIPPMYSSVVVPNRTETFKVRNITFDYNKPVQSIIVELKLA